MYRKSPWRLYWAALSSCCQKALDWLFLAIRTCCKCKYVRCLFYWDTAMCITPLCGNFMRVVEVIIIWQTDFTKVWLESDYMSCSGQIQKFALDKYRSLPISQQTFCLTPSARTPFPLLLWLLPPALAPRIIFRAKENWTSLSWLHELPDQC